VYSLVNRNQSQPVASFNCRAPNFLPGRARPSGAGTLDAVARHLADLRLSQLDSAVTAESVIVQPLGAIEQHGPHLPYSTDQVIADEVCRVAVAEAERAGHDVWLLPTLSYTKSNEHAWDAGTIWLSAETLMAVLRDLGRCVAAMPARRLLFVNAHGGNSALVNVALREIRLTTGLMTFQTHPGVPPDQGGVSAPHESGMGVHGGHDETSIMLHLRPELVDMSLASRNVPEWLADNRSVRFGGTTSFGWLSNDFGPDGHIGDPTQATAEHGRTLFDGSVAALVRTIDEVGRFSFGR
jgi:creatinine amidohydrolase